METVELPLCPVCMTELTLNLAVIITCGHVFHIKCIQDAYNFKNQCPLDRQELTVNQIKPLLYGVNLKKGAEIKGFQIQTIFNDEQCGQIETLLAQNLTLSNELKILQKNQEELLNEEEESEELENFDIEPDSYYSENSYSPSTRQEQQNGLYLREDQFELIIKQLDQQKKALEEQVQLLQKQVEMQQTKLQIADEKYLATKAELKIFKSSIKSSHTQMSPFVFSNVRNLCKVEEQARIFYENLQILNGKLINLRKDNRELEDLNNKLKNKERGLLKRNFKEFNRFKHISENKIIKKTNEIKDMQFIRQKLVADKVLEAGTTETLQPMIKKAA